MKLDVPFFEQEGRNSCAAASLRMTLAYFGKEFTEQELLSQLFPEPSGIIWDIDVARLAGKNGFDVEFYTKALYLNPELLTLDMYQKETDGTQAAKKVERLVKEAQSFGVKTIEQPIPLDEIQSKIDNGKIAIVLLNWKIVDPRDGQYNFQGHVVPIVGLDDKFVYVHQQDAHVTQSQPFMPIPKPVFEAARKSNGTDEDIIFVGKKAIQIP